MPLIQAAVTSPEMAVRLGKHVCEPALSVSHRMPQWLTAMLNMMLRPQKAFKQNNDRIRFVVQKITAQTLRLMDKPLWRPGTFLEEPQVSSGMLPEPQAGTHRRRYQGHSLSSFQPEELFFYFLKSH